MTDIMVTFRLPNGDVQRNLMAGAGVEQVVGLRSPYLVSAGQLFTFSVSAQPLYQTPRDPGARLVDARALGVVHVPEVHRYDLRPSERPLYAILEDVARHNDEYPRHGTDCACMDRFSWEIKRHIGRVMSDEQDPDHTRKLAWRIAHIFGMVQRSL